MYEDWENRSLESNFCLQKDLIILLFLSLLFVLVRNIMVKSITKTLKENFVKKNEVFNANERKLFGSVYRFFVYALFSLYGCCTIFFESWIFTPYEYTLTWHNNLIPLSLKIYYMMEISHYCNSLFFLYNEPRMKDFYQMLLHHLITLLLMGASYYKNLIRYGISVMLIHDLADPFLEMAKILYYLKYQNQANITFFIFAGVFITTRCILFPCLIIGPFTYYSFKLFFMIYSKICIVGCLIIFALNCIWAGYIVSMIISYIKTGRIEGDIRTDKRIDKRKCE